MVAIPPRHFCLVQNPAMRDPDDGGVRLSKEGQVMLSYGDQEIRLDTFQDNPFPLYPGEKLTDSCRPLQIVEPDTALRLEALRDFTDSRASDPVERTAGDQWLLHGPCTYTPNVAETVSETVSSRTIKPLQALKVRARRGCIDACGVNRKAGEEWHCKRGAAHRCS